MNNYLIALSFIISLIPSLSHAEDFPYGTLNLTEITMQSYAKDLTAHAVVLQEFGKSWITTSNFQIRLVHEYHVKIKIFDEMGFEQGNVSIPFLKFDKNNTETVHDISGVTYYTENGIVSKAELASSEIFTDNTANYAGSVKFAMPKLRPGCVIEYKYTLESPDLSNFKKWEFQKDIPKVRSEYEVHIPRIYSYNIVLRGYKKIDSTKAELERACFSSGGVKCDCSKIVYAMNEVPAFVEEAYMTSRKNYLSAIYFDGYQDISLATGRKINRPHDWTEVDKDLSRDEDFGSQLRKTSIFKNVLVTIISGKVSDWDKANAIYTYIQKNIKLNGLSGIYTYNGIRKALDTRSGNVGDINLALVTALNAAGLNTEAVLLSTRENGIINKLAPILSDFNYVIAKVNIADKTYLLDATDPMLPFGLLPQYCINDQGRVMSLNKPSYWIDIKSPQKKISTSVLDLTLQATGKLTGTLNYYTTGYEAYNRRKEIKGHNNIDEYIENLAERLPRMKILKSNIKNVDSLDATLMETYEVELNVYTESKPNELLFNPFFINKITDNPFKAAERQYPVYWGIPSETRCILRLHLPQQFIIESPLAEANLSLPNKGGSFVSQATTQGDDYTFSQVIQLNNSIYPAEEYPYLKELFNKIIQAENADIIFKKK